MIKDSLQSKTTIFANKRKTLKHNKSTTKETQLKFLL